jgi:Astacin (Peptidase family M12A)
MTVIFCSLKDLPERLKIKAFDTAIKINPMNAPKIPEDIDVMNPLAIAVIVSKYWGPQPRRFTVSFMDNTPPDLRAKIVSHMNAWNAACGMSFVETRMNGDVRVSRGPGGYWSYLGTDILHVPKNRQTMNLQDFTMKTDDSEYKRVVRHETGHTLGFPHEHMRKALIAHIDPEKACDFFMRTYGWDRHTVYQQVLTPLEEKSLMGGPPDQTSIMCYQLPGSITRDGKPINGGTDINETDYACAAKFYPKNGGSADVMTGPHISHETNEDWDERDDPDVDV